MAAEDFYYTITAPLRAPELKVRGSRFLAEIAPVSTREEIDGVLLRIRKEFYDATHHCFAYRLGAEGLIVRAADDGEPSGTAGKPILLVLTSQKLTNVLLVVTRYFGGTKLGTGGLARAYVEAAQQAVSMAHIHRVYLTTRIDLQSTYEDLPQVERFIATHGGTIDNTIYLEGATLEVTIRRSMLEPFKAAIIEAFHGRVAVLPPLGGHTPLRDARHVGAPE